MSAEQSFIDVVERVFLALKPSPAQQKTIDIALDAAKVELASEEPNHEAVARYLEICIATDRGTFAERQKLVGDIDKLVQRFMSAQPAAVEISEGALAELTVEPVAGNP